MTTTAPTVVIAKASDLDGFSEMDVTGMNRDTIQAYLFPFRRSDWSVQDLADALGVSVAELQYAAEGLLHNEVNCIGNWVPRPECTLTTTAKRLKVRFGQMLTAIGTGGVVRPHEAEAPQIDVGIANPEQAAHLKAHYRSVGAGTPSGMPEAPRLRLCKNVNASVATWAMSLDVSTDRLVEWCLMPKAELFNTFKGDSKFDAFCRSVTYLKDPPVVDTRSKSKKAWF